MGKNMLSPLVNLIIIVTYRRGNFNRDYFAPTVYLFRKTCFFIRI